MIIRNQTQNTLLASDAELADHFFSRLKGLLGRSALPDGGGLVIRPCNSVHTFGMRFPIDVLFLRRDGCVVKTVHGMGPGRTAACMGASSVVELPAGAGAGCRVGDIVSFG